MCHLYAIRVNARRLMWVQLYRSIRVVNTCRVQRSSSLSVLGQRACDKPRGVRFERSAGCRLRAIRDCESMRIWHLCFVLEEPMMVLADELAVMPSLEVRPGSAQM